MVKEKYTVSWATYFQICECSCLCFLGTLIDCAKFSIPEGKSISGRVFSFWVHFGLLIVLWFKKTFSCRCFSSPLNGPPVLNTGISWIVAADADVSTLFKLCVSSFAGVSTISFQSCFINWSSLRKLTNLPSLFTTSPYKFFISIFIYTQYFSLHYS